MRPQLILASASPSRVKLLQQMQVIPDQIIPADIDETAKKHEKPTIMALRLATEKANKVAQQLSNSLNDFIVIGADTVPVCQNRIMRKAENIEDIVASLTILSGRRHRVYTGLCIIHFKDMEYKTITRLVKTTVKFKRLTIAEVNNYAATQEGIGKAGGYSVAGQAAGFMTDISGSFSNVVGLPLYETTNILKQLRYF